MPEVSRHLKGIACLVGMPNLQSMPRLVDRVIALEPGCWMQAEKSVSLSDSLACQESIIAQAFLTEAITHAGLLLYQQVPIYQQAPGLSWSFRIVEATFPYIEGEDVSVPFEQKDRLSLHVKTLWLRQSQGQGKALGSAHRQDGTLLCQIEFTLLLTSEVGLISGEAGGN